MSPTTSIVGEDEGILCARCTALTGTIDGLAAASSEEGYPYWLSKAELRWNSEICSLCRLIWRGRSWKSTKLQVHCEYTRHAKLGTPVKRFVFLDHDHPLRASTLSSFDVRESGTSRHLVKLFAFTEQGQQNIPIISARPYSKTKIQRRPCFIHHSGKTGSYGCWWHNRT